MTFDKFANMLKPVLLEGNNTANFTRNLILNITNIPDDIKTNPIDYGDDTWKSYLTGKRSIRKTASMINKYIDEEKFITYINDLSDGARDVICEELIDVLPDVNNFNVGEKSANLFKSILIDSTKSAKEKKSNKILINNPKLVEDKNLNTDKSLYEDKLKEGFEIPLLLEANGLCQNYNCCEPLYILENGQGKISYKITTIDPNLPSDNVNNLIALCHKCSDKYSLSLNDENIVSMKNRKKKLILEYDTKEILCNSKLETGVSRAIRKIKNAHFDKLIGLNYNPVSVYEKIPKENVFLLMKNLANVTTYYNYVKDLFKHLDKEGKLKFQVFATQIKLNYLNLSSKNLSQNEIYESLVNWLMNNINEDREPCEIIISFFVQNCEVFDVITK